MPHEYVFVVAKVLKFKFCTFSPSYIFYIEKDFPYSIAWNRIRFIFTRTRHTELRYFTFQECSEISNNKK